MNKKVKLRSSKGVIHEHLTHYLKSTYEERFIWLTKANKAMRQLQKAVKSH